MELTPSPVVVLPPVTAILAIAGSPPQSPRP
jgi:hypothetical protein